MPRLFPGLFSYFTGVYIELHSFSARGLILNMMGIVPQ